MTGPSACCSIQSTGFLLALSQDWVIAAVSANIADFVACDHQALIGRPASDLLTDDAVHTLRNRLALLRDPEAVERLFACELTHDKRTFDVAIHCSGNLTIIEAEPASARTFGDVTATLRGMFARIDLAANLDDFLGEASCQMRALTGFEQVLILRLLPDHSGEVLAQHARAGVPSMIGKRIAADWLSLGERHALQHSAVHVSTDLAAELIPLLAEGEPDLARAILRPLTPACRELFLDLGVRAVTLVALLVGGSLWGVVICLHRQPRSPGFERRSIIDLFAQLLAPRIENLELKAALAEADRSG